jgi:DNA (cytosine-5)-methyltransferase 1
VTIRAVDLFCGAGGSSWGAQKAGVQIVAAFDNWDLARDTYRTNFPNAVFFRGKVEYRNPKRLRTRLGRIDLILASPECTSHSPAKGNRTPCEKSKNTAFQVIRFAKAFKPRWIVIENVVSMRNWSRYAEFRKRLRKLGYYVREQALNAVDFGVPQSRRRLFLLCDRKRMPAEIAVSDNPRKTANTFVNPNGKFDYTPLYKKNRAKPTLLRARRALRTLGKKTSFLLVYYGSDGAGGWQRMNRPLRTVTTVDRFAFVKRSTEGRQMRMLQVPELQIAMGMRGMRFEHGTRRDRIKMLGNAVCPPVMKKVIKTIVRSQTPKQKNGRK